jgi:hypothetical protein
MQQAPLSATQVTPSENVPRYRARVYYQAGLLEVEANNSSLNGILRDISHATGMKLTGGVAEQRVFGNYGPAAPSVVLATLLDGTGSNMLIRETASAGLAELILTPRTGAATPPGPIQPDPDYDRQDYVGSQSRGQSLPQQAQPNPGNQGSGNPSNTQAQQPTSGPQPIPQPWNNVLGSPNNTTPTASSIPTVQSIPTDSLSTPSTVPSVSGIVDSTNPPPAGSTGFGSSTATDSGSNAPKTPEQIMQQLQALQAQRQAQQSGTNTNQSAPTTANPPQ